MIAANATELYIAMHTAIKAETWQRQANDPESCQKAVTYEAKPCREFELQHPGYNIQVCVPYNKRWALANMLHFFAGTEEAEMLENYNTAASRFIVNDIWHGAYGAIAMPQVEECIKRLKSYPNSRRAIVSMGEHLPQDLHRPACWSFLQFLSSRNGLCLIVYQRSLNLAKIMQYDLVVLSNLLIYVANILGVSYGSLFWTIGSLHSTEVLAPQYYGDRHQSLLLPVAPQDCLAMLRNTTHEVWK